MELVSKNNPNRYLIRISTIITLAILVNLIFTFDFLIWAVFLTIILFLLVSQTYTIKIVQDNTSFTAEYIKYFRTEKISIPLNRLSVKIKSNASFRSARYYTMEIYDYKKKVFEVDSRDGFDEKRFLEFANDITLLLSKNRQ